MLEISNLSKPFSLGSKAVLGNVNISIEEGEFCILLGDGKTNLINSIIGTESHKGTIILAGHNISKMPIHERAKMISFVGSDIEQNTISDMNLLENLVVSKLKSKTQQARLYGDFSLEIYRLIKELKLGLEKHLYSNISQISPLYRQIIATLMACISNPKLLLIDNHSSCLDRKSSDKLLNYTSKKVSSSGLSTLMTSDNLEDAIQYGDRILIMSHGRIAKDIKGSEKNSLSKESLFRTIQFLQEGD